MDEQKVEVFSICPKCSRESYFCVTLGVDLVCYGCGHTHTNYQDRKSYDKGKKK